MRVLVVLILLASLLSGCGLSDRFDSAENRINATLPPDSGVQAARQLLLAQIANQPDVQAALEPMWQSRLRLRALSCSRDYAPTWRDSKADIRARLGNTNCFADSDRSLQRWLGLQRVRLMLAQGPIRPVPNDLPRLITHTESIFMMNVARDAPVAIVRGPSGIDILELGSGKSIFKDPGLKSVSNFVELSPNGRLFAVPSPGKVSIRATEGGETLVELPQAEHFVWLDSDVAALLKEGSTSRLLLDLSTGDETAMPGNGYMPFMVRVPGAPHRFNLLSSRGADQIEIIKTDGRFEARLRAEKQPASGRGFSINAGGLSADGTTWIDGHVGLRMLNVDTLALEELSFEPVGTQSAWPTPDPQEFIVSMHLPTGDSVTSHFNYYVYNHRAGTLAPLTRDPSSATRYQYIGILKRLALIDGQTIRYFDKVPAGEPKPVASALAAFIDDVNQRRLAAAVAKLAAEPAGPGAGSAGVGVESTPLHAQLRNVQIEGVGVYEGAGTKHGGSAQPRPAGVVEVRVRRSPLPVALVLTSYEPVRWMIVSEPGARLAAVLVGGYYESTVVGAGAARVYQIGRSYAYGQQSEGYADLQRTVTRWAGKSMTIFQGRYQGSKFSVGGE